MTPVARSLADRFLWAYNNLDEYMRKKLGEKAGVGHTALIMRMAETEQEFSLKQSDLQTFARLRNALIHNPYNDKVDPIAEPHEIVVQEYEAMVQRLLHPPCCLAIAVPRPAIYTTDWEQNVVEVVEVMNKKVYT